ncbi:MAG: aldehyde ferredoxin oxidoreductase C-terminal domain-containing protein, partial [bacterium]|nr:aldehyde ferredoxin oxidoreductase C-terminal domain-containing protein [bacterium]
LSPQDILTVGKRMVNLKQLFNRREGLSLSEIRMPTRTMVPPEFNYHDPSGKILDADRLRRAYCEELGWNPVSGEPRPEMLRELGLSDSSFAGRRKGHSMDSLENEGEEKL